jgi:hypothetical protein
LKEIGENESAGKRPLNTFELCRCRGFGRSFAPGHQGIIFYYGHPHWLQEKIGGGYKF